MAEVMDRMKPLSAYSKALVIVTLFCASKLSLADAPAGSKTQVDLLASVEAVVPGKLFDLGLRFRMAEGWHIYWSNPGDAGRPPRVQWTLPVGISAGAMAFPVPKRHRSPGEIITNVLEEEAILLIPMSVSETAAGPKLRIAGSVNYLVCREQCLKETAEVHVELPVDRLEADVKPAHLEVFEAARKALPSASSKYVTLHPTVSAPTFAPNQKFDLIVGVDIKPGHHIQSHQPLSESFVKADLFVEPVEGVIWERPAFPPGQIRPVKVLGKISEYSGRIEVRVPGTVLEEAPKSPVRFAGVFKYQACNAQGTCFPSDALAFSFVAGQADAGSSGDGGRADDTRLARAESERGPTPGDGTGPSEVEGLPGGFVESTSEPSDEPDGGLEAFLRRLGLGGILLGCLLYGLSINATPCVLPLLSIKVLGFVQQAHESRRRTLALGLAFGIGVIMFFILLGLLASTGRNVLQFPVAVIALGTIVMVMALAMLGVYTLQSPAAAAKLEATIRQEGLWASFGKGALAPVLGFACTGPLLAGVFGWATQQPAHVALLAFLFAGLGMAAPYVLLGANPGWLSFLPKPGPWMITFERIMGFLLLGMVLWLLSPLIDQIGPHGFKWTLIFLVAVAMACWLFGKVDLTTPPSLRLRYRGSAALVALGAGVLIFGKIVSLKAGPSETQSGVAAGHGLIQWRTWTPEAVEETVRGGKIAFVDFTAAYCTVCKENKAVAVETDEFRNRLNELDAVAFQGDFTDGDPAIFAVLQRHNRLGVPLNLIYPAGRPDEPIVLRPSLSKSYLLAKLSEATRKGTKKVAKMGS
jgi:thiol:disulfide interchange protein DsbD